MLAIIIPTPSSLITEGTAVPVYSPWSVVTHSYISSDAAATNFARTNASDPMIDDDDATLLLLLLVASQCISQSVNQSIDAGPTFNIDSYAAVLQS